mmetsp:Transcript_36963/g.106681  ORF Transcript_36963/g.106681 Transcript_36963/m.106681 type:complete len:389 (-) Transcript_36963:7-1173(-)
MLRELRAPLGLGSPSGVERCPHPLHRRVRRSDGADEFLSVASLAERAQEVGEPRNAAPVDENIVRLEIAVAAAVKGLKPRPQPRRLLDNECSHRSDVLAVPVAPMGDASGGILQDAHRVRALEHADHVAHRAAVVEVFKDHHLKRQQLLAAHQLLGGGPADEGGDGEDAMRIPGQSWSLMAQPHSLHRFTEMLRLRPDALREPPGMRDHEDVVHPSALDASGAMGVRSAEHGAEALGAEKAVQQRRQHLRLGCGRRSEELCGVRVYRQGGARVPLRSHGPRRRAARARRLVQGDSGEVQVHTEDAGMAIRAAISHAGAAGRGAGKPRLRRRAWKRGAAVAAVGGGCAKGPQERAGKWGGGGALHCDAHATPPTADDCSTVRRLQLLLR